MHCEGHTCACIRKKNSTRTLVNPRTWIGEEVIFVDIDRPGGRWDRVAELMMIKFSESGHQLSEQRVRCLEERSKAKEEGNYQNTSVLMRDTIEKHFRTIISVKKLSIYGAVSDLCQEYKSCHVRTGRLVLAGQSAPLFVPKSSLMKTPTPSADEPAQEDLLQNYQERLERLSQQNRVIKFCTDAGIPDYGRRQKTLKIFHNIQNQ